MRKEQLSKFKNTPSPKLSELLTEHIILTADGADVCVVMSIPDYHNLVGLNPNPKDKRERVRVAGKLFLEVV